MWEDGRLVSVMGSQRKTVRLASPMSEQFCMKMLRLSNDNTNIKSTDHLNSSLPVPLADAFEQSLLMLEHPKLLPLAFPTFLPVSTGSTLPWASSPTNPGRRSAES
jgi:hypothetical protein